VNEWGEAGASSAALPVRGKAPATMLIKILRLQSLLIFSPNSFWGWQRVVCLSLDSSGIAAAALLKAQPHRCVAY
jgi:hypothetical protein